MNESSVVFLLLIAGFGLFFGYLMLDVSRQHRKQDTNEKNHSPAASDSTHFVSNGKG